MKEHLVKLHGAEQEMHGRLAKTHRRIAKLHRTAAESYTVKSADGIREDSHRSLAAEHDDLADHHSDAAEFHGRMVKALQGAGQGYDWPHTSQERDRGAGGDLDGRKAMNPWRDRGREIRPDGVRGVLPSALGSQLVPRRGSAPVETSQLPSEFADLVKLD